MTLFKSYLKQNYCHLRCNRATFYQRVKKEKDIVGSL